MKFIFICLISEILCIQYLPKEGIINLPTDSNNGSIYLNTTEFPYSSNIYLFFRIYNGFIDSYLSYTTTNSVPISDDEFTYDNTLNYIKAEQINEMVIYMYQFNPLASSKYYVIKYSGFSGSSLNVANSLFDAIAKHIPRRDLIELPSTELNSYIYLKYDDFQDSNDIYLYFRVSNGIMNPNIQYQETNIDPGYIVSFSTPKIKRYDSKNKINEFFYSFPKSDYKYLLVYYSLNSSSTIIQVSSSIQILHMSPNNKKNVGQ